MKSKDRTQKRTQQTVAISLEWSVKNATANSMHGNYLYTRRIMYTHFLLFFWSRNVTSSHPIQVHLKLHASCKYIPCELDGQNPSIFCDFCVWSCFILTKWKKNETAVKLVEEESNKEIMMMMMIWSRKRMP